MQYLIRQSFEWYCCKLEYILIFFLNILVWVNAMQCNVECRLPEKDVILKEPPPMSLPSEGARVGRAGGLAPPRTPLSRRNFFIIEIRKYKLQR